MQVLCCVSFKVCFHSEIILNEADHTRCSATGFCSPSNVSYINTCNGHSVGWSQRGPGWAGQFVTGQPGSNTCHATHHTLPSGSANEAWPDLFTSGSLYTTVFMFTPATIYHVTQPGIYFILLYYYITMYWLLLSLWFCLISCLFVIVVR